MLEASSAGSSAAAACSSSRGSSTTSVHLQPLAKLAAQFARGRDRDRRGLHVELVVERRARRRDRRPLARRHHERLQPARQHGRPGGDARAVACRLLRDRRGDRASEPSSCSSLALVARASPASASSRSTCGRAGRPRVFMGDCGSQLLGFVLASLGLAASWKAAGTTVATMLLPLLVLAIPILDTTLVTVRPAARAAAGDPGRHATTRRTASSTTGSRRRRPSGCWRSSPSRSARPRLAYNVLDGRRSPPLGVLVTFALLVQFGGLPRRALGAGAARAARRHEAPPCDRRAAPAARRARRRRSCW